MSAFARCISFVSIVALGAFLTPAMAQDAGKTAAAWGLLGTWSLDCGQPPSRGNAYLSFVRVDGKLMHRREFGDLRDEFPVVTARATADGALEVTVDLGPAGARRTISFAKVEEGKKRAIANRSDNGDYTIRDGKFVATGAATPVQTRCAVITN